MTGPMTTDRYKSIAAPAEGLFKDKGSRFIAFALPVSGEEEIKDALERLRKEYHDARHICYAYRIGADGGRETMRKADGTTGRESGGKVDGKWRINDDGEPSGTAGRPILGQIDSLDLSDILIAVVRYFGGIKLGVPGLINAYRSAAADALSNASVIEKTACEVLTATFSYEKMGEVMKRTKGGDIRILDLAVDTPCRITLSVPQSQVVSIRQSPWLTFEE